MTIDEARGRIGDGVLWLPRGGSADYAEDDWEPCDHDCDEDCYNDYDEWDCRHRHCFNCGGCGCPGYCDDYVTYNLRPGETGGADGPLQAAD